MTARAAPPADRFEEAETTFSVLVNRLQSEEMARMSHSDLEALLEQQGRELMRCVPIAYGRFTTFAATIRCRNENTFGSAGSMNTCSQW